MHHSTKTSRPAAIYALAIGLTTLLLLGVSAPLRGADTTPAASPIERTFQSSAVGVAVDVSTVNPAVPASTAHSICDRCRTVCARSCSSYACLVCDRSPRCRLTVESCPFTFKWR